MAKCATTTKMKPPRGFEDSEGRGSLCSPTGASGHDHGGQDSAGTGKDALQQSQWSGRLFGNRNAAMSPDRDHLRGGTMVRQKVQRCRAPQAWKIRRLVFLKKKKKLTPSFRRASWVPCDRTVERVLATVLVDMLHDEKEPSEWKHLHVGAEKRVNL